jgi:hypothetical protein
MIGLLFRSRRAVVCSVHEREDHEIDALQRAEDLRFLRDGFSWPVALFTPLALIARASWLALALYVLAAVVISAAAAGLGLGTGWAVLALVATGIIFGFEITAIDRWALNMFGWTEVGVVGGADLEECERRFFDAWLPAQTPKPTAETAPADAAGPSLLRRLFAARP